MRHILKQVVTVFHMGLGEEKNGQRLTAYFWQQELFPQVMHAFPRRPKACIWDWTRTPTGIPMSTGLDLTYMLPNVPSAAVSHAEIEAVSFALPLFKQSGFLAIRLFHSLNIPSQWDSFSFCGSITMSTSEQSSSSASNRSPGLLLRTRLCE